MFSGNKSEKALWAETANLIAETLEPVSDSQEGWRVTFCIKKQ